MAKPKFNPDVLRDRTPSGGLKPLDFMKPMGEESAPNEAATVETPPPGHVAPPALESIGTLERENVRAAVPATAERPFYLPPVDTSEKPFNRGFHMYPSRHEQLGELAHYERRNPWEVIEQALAEYVKRHYGSRAGK